MSNPGGAAPPAAQPSSVDALKRAACMMAAAHVRSGMVVGLGTGSTVRHAVIELGRKCSEEGLDIHGVPTSVETERLALQSGIPLIPIEEAGRIELTIDGADEVTPDFQLTKGMGGALTREKIVAQASEALFIVADPSKLVRRLGEKSPVPVEVVPGYERHLAKRLGKATGGVAEVRRRDGRHYLTDNGNSILDVWFRDGMADPRGVGRAITETAGVVEHGLFLDLAKRVFVGAPEGAYELTRTS